MKFVYAIIFLVGLGSLVATGFAAAPKKYGIKYKAGQDAAVDLASTPTDAGVAIAVPIPPQWTVGNFKFIAEQSHYVYGTKQATVVGYLRDAGGIARGSATVIYNTATGDVVWKGVVVFNQPSTLGLMQDNVATVFRSLVVKGLVIPDQINQ